MDFAGRKATEAAYMALQPERDKRAAEEAAAAAASGAPATTPAVDAVAAPSVQAAPMPATPPIANPQSQVIDSSTNSWTSGSQKQIQTADEKAAIAEGQKLTAQEVDVAKDKGVVATDIALVQEREAAEKARLAEEKAAAKTAALEEANRRIEAAAGNMKAKQDAYAKMSPREFMQGDGDSFRRVASAIAVGLGGYAAGMLGQDNSALKILDKAASDFRQRELDKIKQGKEVADLARQDWQDSQEGKISALKDVDLKYAAFYDKAAEQYAAELARKGIPLAQIAANKEVLAIQQKANAAREETYKGLRETVTKAASGSVTKKALTGDPATFGGPATANVLYDSRGEAVADMGDKVIATKMREKAAAYGDFQNALKELSEDVKKNGRVAPTVMGATLTEAAARRQALRGSVLGSLKKAQELGALDNGVERLVNKTIGSESSALANPNTVGLDQVQKLARAKFANELRTSGVKADASRFEINGAAAGTPGAARTVVKTGTDKQGRKVVKYSDGTLEVQP